MKFVVGFVGIPFEVYDDVYKKRAVICGEGVEFVSRPARSLTSKESAHAQVQFIVGQFAELLKADAHNHLADTGFAIVSIGSLYDSVSSSVFPAVLHHPVEWTFEGRSKQSSAREKNELIGLLRVAVGKIRIAIPAIKKEIKEKDNSTPLLLPLKNFASKNLDIELRQLQRNILQSDDPLRSISKSVSALKAGHPPQKVDSKDKPCFVDDHRVEFHSPGKARHAFARPKNDHPDFCVVNGKRRLGAPYDPAFHYDCQRGRGNLKLSAFSCHGPRAPFEGNPHLNIAPNDFIRI